MISKPVTPTVKWSGQFDCSGVCKRKRLMGEEFSRKALELFRKSGKPMKCRICTEQAQREEQTAAAMNAMKRDETTCDSTIAGCAEVAAKMARCSACKRDLPSDAYNKNQLRKGEDKRRCRTCVQQAEEAEKKKIDEDKTEKIAAAEERVAKASTPAEQLRAVSELSALQAEIVTGLKPIVLGGVKGRHNKRGGRR